MARACVEELSDESSGVVVRGDSLFIEVFRAKTESIMQNTKVIKVGYFMEYSKGTAMQMV